MREEESIPPPHDLLQKTEENYEVQSANFKDIHKILDALGFPGEVADVTVGPTVTLIKVQPSRILRIKQLTLLEENLAFYLRVESVRVTLLNTSGMIGIEIPNAVRSTIRLSSLLFDEDRPQARLSFPAGMDVNNKPVWYSLARMPHLLVAGTTGSGKSVFLHSLITSLMMQYTPDDVRFVLIDPKRVEFNSYANSPHLLDGRIQQTPVQAKNLLNHCIEIMRARYTRFEETNVRNIHDYHERGNRLPFIVIVVDEMADLFASDKTIQADIIRIAQLGRAAGIHIVCATQRPSHDVVSGLLKANFPARAAFRTSSAVDSKVILDQTGAEQLLGSGDGIFITPGEKPKRVTACFVTDSEIEKVVAWWEGQEAFEPLVEVERPNLIKWKASMLAMHSEAVRAMAREQVERGAAIILDS